MPQLGYSRLASQKSGDEEFYMKTFITPALIATLIVTLPLPRLPAQPAHSSEMGFYAPETIEWKAGPPSLPAGAKAERLSKSTASDPGRSTMSIQPTIRGARRNPPETCAS